MVLVGINAWSEISAMIAPYIIYPLLRYGFKLDVLSNDFELSLIIIVIWSTAVWLTVTFLTKPDEEEKLNSFYEKIHPGGIGWQKISNNLQYVKSDTGYGRLFLNWFSGSLMVMFALFGIGKIIFAEYLTGFIFIALSILLGILISYNLSYAEKLSK